MFQFCRNDDETFRMLTEDAHFKTVKIKTLTLQIEHERLRADKLLDKQIEFQELIDRLEGENAILEEQKLLVEV